jgi:hypothetical protein
MNAFAQSSSGEAAPPATRNAADSPVANVPNRAWSRLATAAGPLQAKLTVNAPGDAHEQEADRVADQVMRMPAAPPQIQRMCPHCEEEQKMQAMETPGALPQVGPETEARIGAMQGGGAPLSTGLRGYFEPRLGQDLSAVRVHTGSQAEAAAGEVQARAFTLGPNIAFAPGEFRPETETGKRLLAHELVHTVQQGQTGELGEPAGGAGLP